MIERVVKSKDLRSQPRSGWPFCHKLSAELCEKYYRKSCRYMCNNSKKNRKVKKFHLHIIDQSFERNGMDISYQKRLESLDLKKAVHTSCKHVSEGFVNFIPKEDRPANSRDLTPLETIWIIVDKTDTKIKPPKHWTS